MLGKTFAARSGRVILGWTCMILPVAAAQDTVVKGPGVLKGTIGSADVYFEGTCSSRSGMFEFWSDGTEFAVSRDQNGDNAYLNIMVIGKRASLSYNRDGEKIYNGMFTYATFDGASLTADTLMGRNRLPAKFEVRCEQP